MGSPAPPNSWSAHSVRLRPSAHFRGTTISGAMPQPAPPVRAARPTPDLALWHRRIRHRATPPTCRQTHPGPARRMQRNPGMVRRLDKGRGQHRTRAIMPVRIIAESMQSVTHCPRGQIPAMDIRTNQKTTEIDNPVTRPMRPVPANPRITIPEIISRCRKSQTAQPAMPRTNQITTLCTRMQYTPPRMLACHQLVPDPPLRIVADQTHMQPFDPINPIRHTKRQGHRRVETPGCPRDPRLTGRVGNVT